MTGRLLTDRIARLIIRVADTPPLVWLLSWLSRLRFEMLRRTFDVRGPLTWRERMPWYREPPVNMRPVGEDFLNDSRAAQMRSQPLGATLRRIGAPRRASKRYWKHWQWHRFERSELFEFRQAVVLRLHAGRYFHGNELDYETACDMRSAEAAMRLFRFVLRLAPKHIQIQARELCLDLSRCVWVDTDIPGAAGTKNARWVVRPTGWFLELMAAIAAGDVDQYIADFHGGSFR